MGNAARRMARCCGSRAFGIDGKTLRRASQTIVSCTLIVTAANDFTRPIHDRMPVLLGQHDLDTWLTGKAGVELLRPARNDLLQMWPHRALDNPKGMPNLSLANSQVKQVVAYMLSLRQ